ncbi:MAG: 1-acyl-sn-glycerol-3-phosphate acyltransferase [Alphaproteobacteria bacterium]|nr:1-acyl-sn-glycerol-3-phosphate acyltransferase [Alphaproteobacteria bacterium]
MKLLRCMLFNLSFYGLTTVMCVLCLPALVLPKQAVWFCAKSWARITLFLAHHVCGIKLDLRDPQNLRFSQSTIFSAKHQSAFETIALTLLIPRPSFILKRELLFLPLFGLYLKKIGAVAIDRKAGASAIKEMVKQARARLESGHSLVIFAEGTRSSPDNENPTYLPGVAALYSQLQVPVVPVALNSGLCWGRKAFLKKPGIVSIEFLPPIAAGMDKKAFMATLKSQVETASANLRDEERKRLQKTS